MNPIQRLPASLTPLETVLAALLRDVAPVSPVTLPLAGALGYVAAEMPPLKAFPACDIAASDGWAMRARDLVGASSYSQLPLSAAPVWVEAGDAIPEGCDCVIDLDWLDQAGPMVQALAEAIPGQGVRRAGGEIARASVAIASGRRIRPLDLTIARTAGLRQVNVRRPRLRVVNIPALRGDAITSQLIAETARAAGADVFVTESAGRESAAVVKAFDADACDLLITIGGSGVGRSDATIVALAARGEVVAHGVALQPGRTAAIAKIANTPVIALPGAPDQALAGWWTLALPVLDRLSGLGPRQPVTLPLKRKIASSVGITEVVLLEKDQDQKDQDQKDQNQKDPGLWVPLATGELALDAIARADAWLAVPGGAEGFAAGALVDAYMLRD